MPDATQTEVGQGWSWLTTMPQGAAKTLAGILCLIGTGAVLWGAVILEKPINEAWLWPWLAAVVGVLGVSHLDFRTKRNTYIPSPPNPPDVEDTKGGAGAVMTEVPSQPLLHVDADSMAKRLDRQEIVVTKRPVKDE